MGPPPAAERFRRVDPPRERPAGFSLLELLAVLGLLTLLLVLVVPGIKRTYDRERFREGLRELLVTFRSARSAAATQHRRVRVFLDLRTGNYRLEGSPRTGILPPGIRLADAHLVWQDQENRRGYVAFYGDGSSSGGYLALLDPNGRRYSLDVEIITGKTTLRSGGG